MKREGAGGTDAVTRRTWRGMGGAGLVTGGERSALLRGYVLISLLVLVAGSVNALSVLHDAERTGRAIHWWEPVVWEGTSALASLAFAWLAWLAVRVGTGSQVRPSLALLIHLGAALSFSIAHVATMVGLRIACYALLDSRYSFGEPVSEFLYELRKDVLSYLLFAGLFWVLIRLRAGGAPAPGDPQRPSQPPLFDIRDGSRIVRVPVDEIVAVRSAGNYAEFILLGGRSAMMRTTLGAVAQALGDQGIVRTHRYWLVNPRHIREVASQGSGDYQLTLTGEIVVPQSRRFRHSLSGAREGGALLEPGALRGA